MSQNESSFDPYMQETKRAETIHVRAEAGKNSKSAACERDGQFFHGNLALNKNLKKDEK